MESEALMKRILLFLATNLAIVVLLGIVLQLLGINSILDAQGSSLDLGALLDALENALAVALALDLRRYGQCRHLAGPRFRVRIQRRAAEDHAVVFDDRVVADVALYLRAVTLDQRAVRGRQPARDRRRARSRGAEAGGPAPRRW